MSGECRCDRCGQNYEVWFTSNDLWNAVVRRPDGCDDFPFLCQTCFCFLASHHIKTTGWFLTTSERAEKPEFPVLSAGPYKWASRVDACKKWRAGHTENVPILIECQSFMEGFDAARELATPASKKPESVMVKSLIAVITECNKMLCEYCPEESEKYQYIIPEIKNRLAAAIEAAKGEEK